MSIEDTQGDRQVGNYETPSTAVVAAVSKICDRDPMELPPLYSTIDPDALDGLLPSSEATQHGNNVSVTFVYADRQVTVNGHGTVLVEASDDST